jgi:hypothetical protein
MANLGKLFIGDSIRTIAAGLAAFIAVGGVVLGALYLLVLLLAGLAEWPVLALNVGMMCAFPLAVAAGLVSAGYVVAKIAHRAPFIHSASLVALLASVHGAYRYWGTETVADDLLPLILMTSGLHLTTREALLIETLLIETLLVCLPCTMLGTWIGLRKRRGRGSGETKNI